MIKNSTQDSDATTGALRVIEALSKVGELMSTITDLHNLLEVIMSESKSVVGAEASSLMLYDEKNNDLFFEVALGEKGDEVKEFRLQLGDGIAGTAAKERKIINVKDVAKDTRHYKAVDEKTQFESRSILAVPLVSKDKLIGVLEVLNKTDGQEFTEEDEKVLRIFSDQAAIAIENAQLIAANIQSARLAAMGQAIAGISHYVKNVLSSSQGSTSVIEHGIQNEDLDLIKQVWPILQRSNKKISSLIQDMLAYSKERKPELGLGNVNIVLEEIIEMNRQTASDRGVQLNADLSENVPVSLFDGDKVSDAVLNLVSNSIEACEEDRGVVSICSNLSDDKKTIIIVVSDNGGGIPPEIQKKIFDPFFSTKGSRGTGLGLAITKKAIEEHGGSLKLTSEVGKGTTFTLTIPVIEP